MKKLTAFILVFCMIFFLAACGGKTDKQSDGGTSDKGGESAISNLGFENADDAQRFVENFNSSTDGYAYMVESDAESYEGSLREQGYSVYRILIWSDKDVENRKDTLGDFEGKSPDNNINIRLIYNPDGQLVMLKTLLTVSNSSDLGKTDDAFSCEAMTDILAALFPENGDTQTRELYESLRLPAAEKIGTFETKSSYDSKIELVEHFFSHCGYTVGADDTISVVSEYDCDGRDFRLICNPMGEFQDELYAIYWDISFVSFDDTLVYESILSISA